MKATIDSEIISLPFFFSFSFSFYLAISDNGIMQSRTVEIVCRGGVTNGVMIFGGDGDGVGGVRREMAVGVIGFAGF